MFMGETQSEIQILWESFDKTRSLEVKHKLILSYIWLVKYVVQSMNMPSHVILTDQDFLNFGILGLNEAIERFETDRGVKFESYAIPRIKGTIQDELRRLDWLSRSARKKAHEFMLAGDEIRSKHGREATTEEILRKLNVGEEEYKSYLEAAAAAKLSSFMNESSSLMIDDEEYGFLDEIPDDTSDNLLTKIENEERINFITNYLSSLSKRKSLIMSLYYYENLTFKEIGYEINVSESRVCQIHTEVIGELREKLQEFDNA